MATDRDTTLEHPRLAAHRDRHDDDELLKLATWADLDITADLTGVDLALLELQRSRLTDCRLTGAQLHHGTFTDVIFDRCEFSGATFEESRLTRVEFRDCRMSGVQFGLARLKDVAINGCKLDGAGFRMARAERLHADDCVLRAADFYSAELIRSRLTRCDLTDADFSSAKTIALALNGSTLDALRGASSLAGAHIDATQLVPLGLAMVSSLGVHVDDEADD